MTDVKVLAQEIYNDATRVETKIRIINHLISRLTEINTKRVLPDAVKNTTDLDANSLSSLESADRTYKNNVTELCHTIINELQSLAKDKKPVSQIEIGNE